MEAAAAAAPAAAAPEPSAGGASPTAAVKTVTKEQLLAMMTQEKFKKRFLKQKCAECGVACMKPFASGGPLIARNCIDSFWCADCGRMLCSKHRSHQLHTCEKHNAQLASKRTLTKEQIAAELAQAKATAGAEAERQRIEEDKAKLRRKQEDIVYFEMKRRREVVAGKANSVASFVQGLARKSVTEGDRNREELGELWQRSMRLATILANECHTPTVPGELNAAAWEECFVEVYSRAVELAQTVLTIEGERLTLEHSWDRPEAEAAYDPGAEGGQGGGGM
jgi:hypothetical protein